MTETDVLKSDLARIIREQDRIRAALAHHLDPRSDPCQDRGVDWPCDVADALLNVSSAGEEAR